MNFVEAQKRIYTILAECRANDLKIVEKDAMLYTIIEGLYSDSLIGRSAAILMLAQRCRSDEKIAVAATLVRQVSETTGVTIREICEDICTTIEAIRNQNCITGENFS